VACTLDLIGDRWSLLVLRDLFGGKRRFDEFLASPEGIATNVLTERLARLERERLVTRERDPDDGRRVVYELTQRGRSLSSVLGAIRDWGLRHVPETSLQDFEKMREQARATAVRPSVSKRKRASGTGTKKSPARTRSTL